MKNFRLLLLIFLNIIIGAYQSLEATQLLETRDDGVYRKANRFLDKCQTRLNQAKDIQHPELRLDSLISVIDEFVKARGCYTSLEACGQPLWIRYYALLGDTWEQVFDSISEDDPRCKLQKVHSSALAGLSYLKFCLANGEKELLRSRISNVQRSLRQSLNAIKAASLTASERNILRHAHVVAAVMGDFDNVYALCVNGTDSTIEGIQIRFDHFESSCRYKETNLSDFE